MLKVELIYDADCPSAKDTRAQLLRAFAEAQLAPRWQEWDRGDPESPAYVRAYGSPTVLVNGHDVAPAAPADGVAHCRLYTDPSGQPNRAPSPRTIASALLEARGRSAAPSAARLRGSGWRSALATLPAIGTALLPKFACPACWPAYAGLLSALGITAFNYEPYLLPLTVVFLIPAVALLGYRARLRRGYKPLVAGMLAALMILVGKFILTSNVALYAGVALLVGASLWNAWPKRREGSGSCPACLPAGARSNHQGTHNIEITSERR